jgi:RHS repeat-associated protein
VVYPNTKSITYSNYSSLNLPKTATDERGKITQYTYYSSGKIKDLIDPNTKTYHTDYDGMGRRVDMTYPDGSAEYWTYGQDGLITSWRARGIGSSGAAAGPLKTYKAYDVRLRTTGYTWSDGTDGANGVTISYDAASNVSSMSNASATLSYAYDKLNRVTQETQLITVSGYPANENVSVSYAYNLDGLVKGMTYPSGQTIGLSYNNNNQLTSTGLSDASYNITTAIAQYAYNGDSTFRTRDVLTSADNVHTAYTYNPNGRIGNILTTNAAGTITSRNYNYDALNRITYFYKDVVTGSQTENGKGDFFAYDDSGQLQGAWHEAPGVTSASWTSPPTGAQRYEKYTFDGPGNRLTEDLGSGPVSYTASTSDPNQYITAASNGSVTYDNPRPSGNTKMVGGLSCLYDANNRMVTASLSGNSVAFFYDPKGRCVARTVNGGSFLANYYAAWNLVEDRDGTATVQRIYVQGTRTDETAAVRLYSGGVPTTWMGYHYDALGNVTHLTGTSGTVVERYGYNAFGSPYLIDGTTDASTAIGTTSSNAVGRRLAFQGHEFIPQLGVYDFRNRMLHSPLGRFMQPDPIRLDAGDNNIYRYCSNNPITQIDPSGLDSYLGTIPANWYDYGHSILIIQNNSSSTGYTTVQFYPCSPGAPNGPDGLPVQNQGLIPGPGRVVTSDTSATDWQSATTHFDSTDQQDSDMLLYSSLLQQDTQWQHYNVLTNNCSDFANTVLTFTGVTNNTTQGGPLTPADLYNNVNGGSQGYQDNYYDSPAGDPWPATGYNDPNANLNPGAGPIPSGPTGMDTNNIPPDKLRFIVR